MEGNYAFYILQTHAQLTVRCVRLRNINVSGGAHIVLLRSDIHKNLSIGEHMTVIKHVLGAVSEKPDFHEI